MSASEKFNTSVIALLSEIGCRPVSIANSIVSAKRMILEEKFDIVIINTPLPDDFGVDFAIDICDKWSVGVLLAVKSENYPQVNNFAAPYGVLTVAKPSTSQTMIQSVQLLCGTCERLRRMERKTATLESKMDEIRKVNKAKCLLIEKNGMTEKEAHRYIEKQAMDRCETKLSIAEKILMNME